MRGKERARLVRPVGHRKTRVTQHDALVRAAGPRKKNVDRRTGPCGQGQHRDAVRRGCCHKRGGTFGGASGAARLVAGRRVGIGRTGKLASISAGD